MGFGSKFCGLTAAIYVSFSIRQGDPIAMLLYIVYVEPLLTYIGAKIGGLYWWSILAIQISTFQC